MKNGKLKRIIASLLSIFTLTTVVLATGCKNTDSVPDSETIKINNNVDGGLHQGTVTETENKLVSGGRSDYQIVISSNATKDQDLAAVELVRFFNEATGIILPRIYDTQVTFNENSKYIVIGNTTLNETAKVSADVKEVKTRGFIIKTVGKSIFIVGGTDEGAVNGVYEFLELMFDYDYFAPQCYTIQRGVKEKALYNFDLKEAPDINHVTLDYTYKLPGDALWRTRYRTMHSNGYALWIGDYVGHNAINGFMPTDKYLNPDDPENYHPEWYANANGNQPCWTAHGDRDSRELMLNVILETIQAELKDQPKAEYLLYGIEDNRALCGCDSCQAKYDLYGQPSGLYIEFANEIRSRLDEWFKGEGAEYYRPFTLQILAYLDYDKAPIKYDEDGKPYATIKCADGVVPQTAYIRHDYQYAIDAPEVKETYTQIKNWSIVADSAAFYFYDTNFLHIQAGYNTFESLQSNYRIAFECGSDFLFNQSAAQCVIQSGWSMLKMYWQSKLGWDVNSDMDYYTQKFFDNYFGPGAESMKKWFMEWRAHTLYMRDELGYNMHNPDNLKEVTFGVAQSSLYLDTAKSKYWSISLLDRWMEYAEDALKAIEPLKLSDPEQYEIYYKAVILERVALSYLLVESFGSQLGNREMELKLLFKEDATLVGVARHQEHTNISELYKKWEI